MEPLIHLTVRVFPPDDLDQPPQPVAFLMNLEHSLTFSTIWKLIDERYQAGYPYGNKVGWIFKTIQDADFGADISLSDTLGAVFAGEDRSRCVVHVKQVANTDSGAQKQEPHFDTTLLNPDQFNELASESIEQHCDGDGFRVPPIPARVHGPQEEEDIAVTDPIEDDEDSPQRIVQQPTPPTQTLNKLTQRRVSRGENPDLSTRPTTLQLDTENTPSKDPNQEGNKVRRKRDRPLKWTPQELDTLRNALTRGTDPWTIHAQHFARHTIESVQKKIRKLQKQHSGDASTPVQASQDQASRPTQSSTAKPLWSDQDDELFIQAVRKGQDWRTLHDRRFPNRSDSSVMKHFADIRHQVEAEDALRRAEEQANQGQRSSKPHEKWTQREDCLLLAAKLERVEIKRIARVKFPLRPYEQVRTRVNKLFHDACRATDKKKPRDQPSTPDAASRRVGRSSRAKEPLTEEIMASFDPDTRSRIDAERKMIRDDGKTAADRAHEEGINIRVAGDRGRTKVRRERSKQNEAFHLQLEEHGRMEEEKRARRLAEDLENRKIYNDKYAAWHEQAVAAEEAGGPIPPSPKRPLGSSIGTELATGQQPVPKVAKASRDAVPRAPQSLKTKSSGVEVRIPAAKKQKLNDSTASTVEDVSKVPTSAQTKTWSSPVLPTKVRSSGPPPFLKKHRQAELHFDKGGRLTSSVPPPTNRAREKIPDSVLISSDDESSYSDPDLDDHDLTNFADNSSVLFASSPPVRARVDDTRGGSGRDVPRPPTTRPDRNQDRNSNRDTLSASAKSHPPKNKTPVQSQDEEMTRGKTKVRARAKTKDKTEENTEENTKDETDDQVNLTPGPKSSLPNQLRAIIDDVEVVGRIFADVKAGKIRVTRFNDEEADENGNEDDGGGVDDDVDGSLNNGEEDEIDDDDGAGSRRDRRSSETSLALAHSNKQNSVHKIIDNEGTEKSNGKSKARAEGGRKGKIRRETLLPAQKEREDEDEHNTERSDADDDDVEEIDPDDVWRSQASDEGDGDGEDEDGDGDRYDMGF